MLHGGSQFAQRYYWLFALLTIAGLTLFRLPSVWYRMGGQDEQWYTVPGWTVAATGIPRIPYVPTDDPESVFQDADRILYALPPAYFYVQAPFFWLFPAGYGTARLASVLAGVCCLLFVCGLLRQLGVHSAIAIGILPVCAMGRAFFFPWQDSRPDMLCAMFGLAAIWVALYAAFSGRWKLALVAGLLVGLGAVSHPYAIVFAVQVGAIFLCSPQPWKQRLLACVLAAAGAVAGLSPWGLLIALDPQLFWAQFSSNVLSRSGPGLLSRMLWPWPFVAEQARLISERLGPFQVLLLLAVSLIGFWFSIRQLARRFVSTQPSVLKPSTHKGVASIPEPQMAVVIAVLLCLSGLYLHVASLGYHPAQGYLCYPWALLVILLACLLQATVHAIKRPGLGRMLIAAGLATALLVMIPGSGLRATWIYATRNAQPVYNRQEFCRLLDQQFPAGAKLLVSPEYVFEFELLGRRPINASRLELYHDVAGLPFDYLIASTQAFDEGLAAHLNCRLAWEFGNAADELACYVKVYVPTSQSPTDAHWPR